MANYKKQSANAVLLADKMRKSVLQAAIEGKLTTQNPAEDGDARDLLAEIQAEKQRLIAAGDIKREKALPPIAESELPFDIPENWVWVRLGDVVKVNPRNKAEDEIDSAFMPMTLLDDGYKNSFTFEARKWSEIKKGFTHFAENDIVFAKITPCFQNRKSAIISNIPNKIGAGTTELHVLRNYGNYIELKYLLYFVKNPIFINAGVATYTGTAGQQRISSDFVKEYLFPLPPLAEQQRIVEKLEQILPQLDRLQADENKLHAMQTAFPSRMQASLLQAAIEGKLTTQNPKTDGIASDLLEQIQAEKQRLVDAKEIKREKPLPAITEEEKPFDIPENWEWVRLSQIGEIISGGTPKTTNLKYWQNGDIPWITPADMKNVSKYISKGARNITKAGLTSSSARLMPKGSVLFSSRAPIGYVAIAENEISTNQGFKSIVPFNFNLSEYLYFALMALANDIAKLGTGTTFKEVSGATVSNILIPLPPLAEQERIVAKLDALLPKVQALNDL